MSSHTRFLVFSFFCLLLASKVCSAVEVQLAGGKVMGYSIQAVEQEFSNTNVTLDIFKGIPYAEPPERFAAPVPKQDWDFIWNATYYRDSCVQYSTAYGPVSEDCLYLNVIAPQSSSGEKFPVMVWIHGGGFSEGTAMSIIYDGSAIAATNKVVHVAINYRLNVLGFVTTGDEVLPGNYGMLDQAEALKWIKENIEAFGGDSKKITIYGESAGGASVSYHLFSAMSQDYFDNAIMESGTLYSSWAYYNKNDMFTRDIAFALGAAINCSATTSEELKACLMEADPLFLANYAYQNQFPFSPRVDGVFMTDTAENLWANDMVKDCPILLGSNRDEGTIYPYGALGGPTGPTPPEISREQFDWFFSFQEPFISSKNRDFLIDSVEQEYFDWSKAENPEYDYYLPSIQVAGDHEFICPTMRLAEEWAQNANSQTFVYFMTHVPSKTFFSIGVESYPEWLGATHTEEIPYVFGYGFLPIINNLGFSQTNEEKALSISVMKYWANFAKTGDPNQEDSDLQREVDVAWPTYSVVNQRYLELALNLTEGTGVRADQCHFWLTYLPMLDSYFQSMDDSELQWRQDYDAWKKDLDEWRMAFDDYQNNPTCT